MNQNLDIEKMVSSLWKYEVLISCYFDGVIGKKLTKEKKFQPTLRFRRPIKNLY